MRPIFAILIAAALFAADPLSDQGNSSGRFSSRAGSSESVSKSQQRGPRTESGAIHRCNSIPVQVIINPEHSAAETVPDHSFSSNLDHVRSSGGLSIFVPTSSLESSILNRESSQRGTRSLRISLSVEFMDKLGESKQPAKPSRAISRAASTSNLDGPSISRSSGRRSSAIGSNPALSIASSKGSSSALFSRTAARADKKQQQKREEKQISTERENVHGRVRQPQSQVIESRRVQRTPKTPPIAALPSSGPLFPMGNDPGQTYIVSGRRQRPVVIQNRADLSSIYSDFEEEELSTSSSLQSGQTFQTSATVLNGRSSWYRPDLLSKGRILKGIQSSVGNDVTPSAEAPSTRIFGRSSATRLSSSRANKR